MMMMMMMMMIFVVLQPRTLALRGIFIQPRASHSSQIHNKLITKSSQIHNKLITNSSQIHDTKPVKEAKTICLSHRALQEATQHSFLSSPLLPVCNIDINLVSGAFLPLSFSYSFSFSLFPVSSFLFSSLLYGEVSPSGI